MPLTLATTTPGEPEIFASLQGEGLSTGRPSTFVRLSRCNLACTWCDTAYTWRFTGPEAFDRKTNQVVLTEEDTATRIMALGGDRLVLTGGEPLLQAPSLTRLLTLVQGHHVEIETNGTVAPPPALDALIDQYNVSPKLRHSGNQVDLAQNSERLEAWARQPKANFKFVISAPDDLTEVFELQSRYTIPSERIFLMPEGTTSAVLQERSRWLAVLCQDHGLRFSDRLHIHLYGDTRGT